ncbi:MAG TPA: hypothetical protein ENG40_01415, partial [Thermoprotei archaeon]|nr:hypothetical protein [Thermoprotei archaeon]
MRSILHREVFLKDPNINIILDIIALQTEGQKKYCIKSFTIFPLSPLEAELIVEKFNQNLVWYYLGENKIVFYPQKIGKLCFFTMEDIENIIVNSIIECIRLDVSKNM